MIRLPCKTMCMMHPVSPNHSPTFNGEDLFAPDGEEAGDEHPADGADDGWDKALAAAEKNNTSAATDVPDPDEPNVVCQPCNIDTEDAATGSDWEPITMAQRPVPLPDVKMPSRAEVARHMLTHLPYRRWCVWRQMARRNNVPHRARPPSSRDLPLLVFEYCFQKMPPTRTL